LVKTPLCVFDIKSGIFCAKCEEKIRSGEVTDLDVKMARLLMDLEGKFPVLQDVTFHKAVEAAGVLAIVVDHEDVQRMLSHGGKIIRAISDDFKRKVRVLEVKGDLRSFLEDLFFPASIVSINTIWVPDGSTEIRVVLSGKERSLPIDVKSVKKLAQRVRGITLRVDFERPPTRRLKA